MFCPNCGADNTAGSTSCRRCEEALSPAAASAPVPPPAPIPVTTPAPTAAVAPAFSSAPASVSPGRVANRDGRNVAVSLVMTVIGATCFILAYLGVLRSEILSFVALILLGAGLLTLLSTLPRWLRERRQTR